MSLIIILITIGVSVYAFSRVKLMDQLSLKPVQIVHRGQWYRLFSHALVHADYVHLLVNMYVLWIFGSVCEQYFQFFFVVRPGLIFVLLYLLSLVFSSLYSVYRHRRNYAYTAVGASGAVMAVVFTSIFFDPWNRLYIFGVLPLPGILFGILYLGYSVYMGRKASDNIGHDAHFFGALFGFVFPGLLKPHLWVEFIQKIMHP